MKSIRTILAAATTLGAAILATPSHAAIGSNGIEVNGVYPNGMSPQGSHLNGINPQGIHINGMNPQGPRIKGTENNGNDSMSFRVIAVTLPVR